METYEAFTGEQVPERLRASSFTEGLINFKYAALKIEIENKNKKRKITPDKAYKQAM